MTEEFHGFAALRLTDPARLQQEYQQWRQSVLRVRELPEYKLRKLWKLNYKPADIAADRR